jgi:hypothetical protein
MHALLLDILRRLLKFAPALLFLFSDGECLTAPVPALDNGQFELGGASREA